MRKSINSLLSLTLLAAFAFVAPATSYAAKGKKGEPAEPALTGKISAVDKEAKTVTVDSKVITIDSTTSIISTAGQVLALDKLKVGDHVQISTVNLANKLTAVTVRVGNPVSAASDAGSDAKPKKKKKKTS